MDWQRIAHLDPYLAGSIAARTWQLGLDETTAQEEAASVGLTGDRLAHFLRGWADEMREREAERNNTLYKEYEQMASGYEKGDPAAR